MDEKLRTALDALAKADEDVLHEIDACGEGSLAVERAREQFDALVRDVLDAWLHEKKTKTT